MDIKVQTFKEKINTTNDKFFSALDDFKKYYVYHNTNPEVNEYQNFYTNSVSQLQSINSELFLASNDIGVNIEAIEVLVEDISKKLEDEKKTNASLMATISNITNTQNGSEVLISDSKYLYTSQYINNIEMIVGIFIISIMLSKFFKNTVSVPIGN
jgi:hypothetical protein